MEKKWYQKISNWVFIILFVLLFPILIMNLWVMFQAKTNPDEVPSIFGYKPFIVLSGSMETEIYKGDLVIVKNILPETLQVNDIIAFRDAEDTVTTHRIIDIVNKEGVNYFITKGDNNNTQDQNLVEYSDVEGKYVLRIPGIGSIMNSLAKPTTILIVLMGITLIFVIGFTISSKKQRDLEKAEFLEYKRQKEEEELKAKEAKKKTSKKTSSKKTSTKKKNN